MKRVNLKYIALSFIALATLTLQSCSSDQSYDVVGNPNNLFYIKANSSSSVSSPNTLAFAVVHTPVGDFGNVKAKFPIRSLRAVDNTAKVTAKLDNSLIDAYNTKYATSYVKFPDGTLNVDSLTATILKGQSLGEDSLILSVPSSALSQLTGPGYIAPIRITSISGADGTDSEDYSIGYVIVTTSTKFIKANVGSADMQGTLITDYSSWTGSSDTGTASTFSQMFTSSNYSGWSFSANPSTMIIDMQETKNLTGFRMMSIYGSSSSYSFKNVAVAVSTDGANYTDCGSATSSEMTNQSGYQYICFYGSMSCRYLKLTVTWASSYGSYYYKIVHFGAYVK